MSDITFESAGKQMVDIINAVGEYSFGIIVEETYKNHATAVANVLSDIKRDYGSTLRILVMTNNKIEALKFVRLESSRRGVNVSLKDVKELVESL